MLTYVRVDGIAYDSLAGRPLAGAMISVIGLGRSVTSDAKGRFRIDSVPAGSHTFLIQHPAFDSVGLPGSSKRVAVQSRNERVVLALPSFERLWRGTCGDAPFAADSGIVYGVIRDADTQYGVAGVAVDLSWVDLVGGGSTLADIAQRRWRRATVTDAMGEFAACGVPLATPLSLRVTRDSVEIVGVGLPATKSRVQRRDLLIGAHPTRARGSETISASPVKSTASGVIAGLVVNESGAPIANAAVSVGSLPDRHTGEDGKFAARELGGGMIRVSVRAIGKLPFDSLVSLPAGDTASLLVSMSPVATLDAVKVTATVTSARVRSYEDRKRGGFGAYRDSAEIKKYPSFASLLRTVPNVTIRSGSLGGLVFNMGTSAQCSANREQVDFRLDGMPITAAAIGTLDMESLAAVEVYSRATKLPAELASSIHFRCAVLIWTKQGFGR